MSRLAVIGADYVGLVSATVVHRGHYVCCADIVPEKVAILSRDEIPMVELGCSSRGSRVAAAGRRAGNGRTARGAAWTSR